MSEQAEPLSRRKFFTNAVPRGLAQLAGGVLRARADIAFLAGLADPHAARLRDLDRQIDELLAQNRREHTEWFADVPDVPDLTDPEAVRHYLDELEERTRRDSEELQARWRREHPEWYPEPPGDAAAE